ncbi:sodium:calcium antiporter [Candidatus Gottesmanbacteria bacterium]|nr:sodium:calcium antiporter [Candidatus Gottesmanbacteria bacterium]
MNIFLDLGLLAFACWGISKCAQLVVNSVKQISKRAKISDFTLGFFVLGIATSSPEFFIGVNSVIGGYPQLSLGNLIGGIIVLLTLLMGVSAIYTGKISFKKTLSKNDFILTGVLLLLPAVFLFDGGINRIEGLVLIGIYIGLFLLMNKEETILEEIRDKVTLRSLKLAKLVIKVLAGIAGLIIFSKIIVEAALIFTKALNISPLIVGLLLLSIGTNLPELTLGFFAKSKDENIAVGDFLGSAAANVLFIGLLATVYPFEVVSVNNIRVSLLIMIISILVFITMVYRKNTITRKDGIILLAIYAVFVVWEIVSSGIY